MIKKAIIALIILAAVLICVKNKDTVIEFTKKAEIYASNEVKELGKKAEDGIEKLAHFEEKSISDIKELAQNVKQSLKGEKNQEQNEAES